MNSLVNDTIAAVATPSGKGGIGIIRISGPKTQIIAKAILGFLPKPRMAEVSDFRDQQGNILDQGIALFFANPHSFTGEDVLELQGHGGPIILDCILREVIALGARHARPGEFSERAFLNDKIDLTQAESIADLIDAATEQAAKAALRSLQGDFSKKINQINNDLIQLRMYVEAAIDFPEEEIDFLNDGKILSQVDALLSQLENIEKNAKQGSLLREGMTIVIAGAPNAGKSSLLNALSGNERAIVTDIPGTTRDVLKDFIEIDGMPVHIVDTAGLRHSTDVVEKEGIRRAVEQIKIADRVLWVVDSKTNPEIDLQKIFTDISAANINLEKNNFSIVYNKIDQSQKQPEIKELEGINIIYVSAKTEIGLDLLKEHLKQCMGYKQQTESQFIARRRHLTEIALAKEALLRGKNNLVHASAGELLAEELRLANNALGEITGRISSDDLLGKIFSTFCIGK